MKLPIALGTLALLGLAVLAPTGSAAATWSCTVDLSTTDGAYACHVNGAGGAGTLDWCPNNLALCLYLDAHVIGCHVDQNWQYAYCWM